MPRQTVFAHDARRSRKAAAQSLAFQGAWYEDYDYLVAIDAENMLTVYPRQPVRITGDVWPRRGSFRRTPVSGIYRIRRGGGGYTKITLSSELPRREEENTVLLDLWSDADISEFIALLCNLTVRRPGILAVDKKGSPPLPDDIGEQFRS
jgi:hypothetical protein